MKKIFKKTIISDLPTDFEKLTSACYFQISRETMLLLINNLHKSIRDNQI